MICSRFALIRDKGKKTSVMNTIEKRFKMKMLFEPCKQNELR